MAVTSGFYNSVNGDRTYDAEQMSSLFEGIIGDGVLMGIGNMFAVSVSNETRNRIKVDTGRAWFNKTWVNNDAVVIVDLSGTDPLLDRIDAVIIEIDKSESVRAAKIKIITGTAASTPTKPTMSHTDEINQYPLAYISRKAGATKTVASDITNCVGTSECPYVTGLLNVHSIDNLVAQWQAEFDEWFSEISSTGGETFTNFLKDKQAEINAWFEKVKNTLGQDAATNLALQIVEINDRLDNFTITCDTELSATSTNPVQNKVIKEAIDATNNSLDQKIGKTGGVLTGSLVANSGADYTSYRVRNIALATTAALPSNQGDILGVYS